MSDPGDKDRLYGGRYELRRGIARGGMADVFLARDQLLDRPVALKILFPELSSDANFVERFRREAQSAANLSHPNIVGVFDWGETDDVYFIVMEYVDGQPLSRIIRDEGPLLAERAADIAVEIASALGSAHAAGVIHRDVKPSNVLIKPEGTVKVADFGIARAISAADGLTQTGAVMGTASYFSPEQARGHAMDARSDVYSLGVVMYEMVVGEAPFTGDSPVTVAYKHVNEQPVPIRERNPDVAPAFAQIVAKAMAKDAADRYQSANELAEDLRRFRSGRSVSAAPIPAGPPPADATVMQAPVDATTAMPTAMAPAAHTATHTTAGPPPRKTGAFVGVVLAILAVLALVIFLLVQLLNQSETSNVDVTVPSVFGIEAAQARSQLETLGLEVEEEFAPNDETPAGLVFDQDPKAGAILKTGDVVTIKVSQGEAPVTVENVVGQHIDDATDVLENLGLVVTPVPQASDSIPENQVIEQSPVGGQEVPKGTEVRLTYSSGLPSITVPDVSGKSPSQAANELGQAGFQTGQEIAEPSDDVPQGQVIRTDPPAGTEATKGATVTLFVSSGPATVEVPSVIGLSEQDAIDEIEAAGLVANVVDQFSPNDGEVIDQDPPGGSQVERGSTVTITVGRNPGSGDE